MKALLWTVFVAAYRLLYMPLVKKNIETSRVGGLHRGRPLDIYYLLNRKRSIR